MLTYLNHESALWDRSYHLGRVGRKEKCCKRSASIAENVNNHDVSKPVRRRALAFMGSLLHLPRKHYTKSSRYDIAIVGICWRIA